jgi:predicted phage-related endonuclease
MTPPIRPEAITEALDNLEDQLARDVAASVGALPFTVVCDSRDRSLWLKARTATIGASESAVVLGAAPPTWSSLLTLWAVKTKRQPPDESVPEWQFWGLELEDGIINGYGKRTGRFTLPFGLMLRSTRFPWMSATPDAIVTDDPQAATRAAEISRTLGHIRAALKKGADTTKLIPELARRMRGWWPLQVKNIGFTSVDDWSDGVPLYYTIQCLHEAIVFGAKTTTAGALVSGQRLVWDDVHVDMDGLLERQIVNLTRMFMRQHIEQDVQPPPDGSDQARRTLSTLYPVHTPGKVLPLGHDMMETAYAVLAAKAKISALQAEIDLKTNLIREAIGDAERASFPDGSGYTLKANVNGSRVLLHKPSKD